MMEWCFVLIIIYFHLQNLSISYLSLSVRTRQGREGNHFYDRRKPVLYKQRRRKKLFLGFHQFRIDSLTSKVMLLSLLTVKMSREILMK